MAIPKANRKVQGYTLVELLLATALTLLLASALIFSFSSLLRATQLEEGVGRLESLIRFARAQAAYSGRKVQLVLSPEVTSGSEISRKAIRLNWEPDPLDHPGQFEELTDLASQIQGIDELLEVRDVQLLSADGTSASSFASETGEAKAEGETAESKLSAESFSAITFYPDGSSDSAEIILASRTAEDEQRVSVRLVGMTGSISHRPMGGDESEPSLETAYSEEDATAAELK